MLQKSAHMLVALSASTYVRHVAEWNGRGEKLDSAFVRREDSFWLTGDRQACLKRLCQARNDV